MDWARWVAQADMPAEVVPKILGDKEAIKKVPKSDALRVCIMTADFWGLKSAGGTATAYHLLAAVLAKEKNLHVSAVAESLAEWQMVIPCLMHQLAKH